jgi:mannose-1-phosphate guanylyltransferase
MKNQNWFGKIMLTEFRFSIITGYSFHRIDYAVMERSKKNKGGYSKFDWSDLGSLNRYMTIWLALVIQLTETETW